MLQLLTALFGWFGVGTTKRLGVGAGAGSDLLTLIEPEVPTQYADPNQKLVLQSFETAGFQA